MKLSWDSFRDFFLLFLLGASKYKDIQDDLQAHVS